MLRKLGLRPGYDWALSVLAVRVVFWQERTVPGLHQPGGLVEHGVGVGNIGLGSGPGVLTCMDWEVSLISTYLLTIS